VISFPLFLEFLTYRIREHVGPLLDYDRGYRSKEEVEAWIKHCPISQFKDYLIANQIMSFEDIEKEEEKFELLADSAYEKALASPWPQEESLLNHVY